MADIQRWRLHLARPRPSNGRLIADQSAIRPDSPSPSTSPEFGSVKHQPEAKRSFASFASYLNTHSRSFSPSDTSQWPSIDWSTLNENDHVYNPHNAELMCNSIIKQILTDPSKDLPAQYNSAVLHILESYTRLISDHEDLQKKLEATATLHQADLDKLDQAHERWSEDAKDPELQLVTEKHYSESPRNRREQPKSIHEYLQSVTNQKIGEEALQCGQRHSNGDEEAEYGPHSPPVHKTSTLDPKTNTLEIHQYKKMSMHLSPPSAAAECGFSSLQHGLGSDRDRNLRSPSVNPGTIGVKNGSNSSLQKNWLTCRARSESNDALAMNAALFPQQPTAIESAAKETSPEPGSRAHDTNVERQATAPEVFQPLLRPKHKFIHHRDFSFLPGDDFESLFQIRRKTYNPPMSMIANPVDFSRTGGHKGSAVGDGAVGLLAFETALGTSHGSTAGRTTSDGPRQDKSRKSSLTAFKGISNHNSSTLRQDSPGSQAENDPIQDPTKSTAGSEFAIAAARAAKQSTQTFQNARRNAKH